MAEASYPNFAGKHAGEAMYTAADFIAYMRQVGAFADGEVRTAVSVGTAGSLQPDLEPGDLALYQAAVTALLAGE